MMQPQRALDLHTAMPKILNDAVNVVQISSGNDPICATWRSHTEKVDYTITVWVSNSNT
jgi:hypothetical protein